MDDEDKWTKEAEEVKRMFCDYFANLFTSTNSSQAQIETALQDIPVKVIEEMNEMLDQPFTDDEISETLEISEQRSVDNLQAHSQRMR